MNPSPRQAVFFFILFLFTIQAGAQTHIPVKIAVGNEATAIPYQGFYLNSEAGYDYQFSFGLVLKSLLGVGYLHTFTTQEEYQLKNGDYVHGIQMAVQTPVEELWLGTSGNADLKNEIELQSCNITRVGSTVKTFTSVTVLLLQEEEKLNLDDKVSEDLNLFITSLFDGEIISQNSLDEMTSCISPHTPDTDFFPLQYGLGIFKLALYLTDGFEIYKY